MAKPKNTSLDTPPFKRDGDTITIFNQNWQQGDAYPPESLNQPRFVFAHRVDGGPWSAETPPAVQKQPFGRLLGEDARVFDLLEGTHVYDCLVWAGTHSVYAGAYDVYEFGGPAAFSFTATHTAAVPPPPPPPAPPSTPKHLELLDVQLAAQAGLYPMIEQWRREGVSDDAIRNSFIYALIRLCGIDPKNSAARGKVRDFTRDLLGY